MSRIGMKQLLCAASLAAAGAAHASAPLLSEGFDDVSSLAASGWVTSNLSSPAGSTGWFQGSDYQFAAQAGGTGSYVAANYNSGVDGGTIDDWLISPTFSTASAGVVTLWLKGSIDAGYADTLKFGFSHGGASAGDFTTGPVVTAVGDWTQYTFSFASGGAGSVGRFAIEYTGLASASDYVGIDTLSVSSVPEPASFAMFGLGLLGLAAARRRVQR